MTATVSLLLMLLLLSAHCPWAVVAHGNSTVAATAVPATFSPANVNSSTPVPKDNLTSGEQQLQVSAGEATQQPSDKGSPSSFPLTNFPNCSSKNSSSFLPAGLYVCEVQGLLERGQADAFSFDIAEATDSTRPYRLLLALTTVDGSAQLGLSTPNNAGETDPVPDEVGTQVFSTAITFQSVLGLPWGKLAMNPGKYIISISHWLVLEAQTRVMYTLRVFTPFDDVMLLEPDLSVMKDVYKACCREADATSTFCSDELPATIAPDNSPDVDMCQMIPMVCDQNGHLTKLTIAQYGLKCAAGLPDSFTQLQNLETLDLAFNDINMDIRDMGKILGQLPALQNAFLLYTGLIGQLTDDCNLIKSINLTRLSISANNITGSLPACFLQHDTLQELYVSQTGMTGIIPDVVPHDNPLRLFYAINFIQGNRPGFTGPLPRSLLASPAMRYVDLSNNKLSGGLPTLSSGFRLLNLRMNALDGKIHGTLPASLEILDLALNQLQGPLPQGLEKLGILTTLDVHHNRLSGGLPQVLPESLSMFDVSNNSFTGTAPPLLPAAMQSFRAAGNQLSGQLPSAPDPSLLMTYDMNGNNITGMLPTGLINGSAPELHYLDVRGNRLSGHLDGSSSSSAGRKMLQKDDGGGTVWADKGLGYLGLSYNNFTGTIPASLGNLTSLVMLELSSNRLSGSLKPFADTLAAAGAAAGSTLQSQETKPLLTWLDVSDNQLTGPIPESLQYAPMMDPGRVTRAKASGQYFVLDLSNNSFSGPFPTQIAIQSAQVAEACQHECLTVYLGLTGPNMNLSCPGSLKASSANPRSRAFASGQIAYLRTQDYQCVDASGEQVPLLSAVNASDATSAG